MMSTNDDASDNNGTLRRHHVRLSLCISRLKASLKSDGDGNQLIEALPCYEQPQPSHSFVMTPMIMMTLMTTEERERESRSINFQRRSRTVGRWGRMSNLPASPRHFTF